jgi:hypothetical protein
MQRSEGAYCATKCAGIVILIWKACINIENAVIRLPHARFLRLPHARFLRLPHARFQQSTSFALLHIHKYIALHLPRSRAPQPCVQSYVTCSNTYALLELHWFRIVLSSSRTSDTGHRCPAIGAEMCDTYVTAMPIKMHSVLGE